MAVSTTIAKKKKNSMDYSNGAEKRDGFKDKYQGRLYIVQRLHYKALKNTLSDTQAFFA